MTADLVGIIIPIYNVENYLSECLNSVLSQTYKNIVVIMIDDGSNDNSFEIAKQFERSDSRFHAYTKVNAGVSSARNVGIDLATKVYNVDFIAFIDSDDYIDKKYVETFITALKITKAQYGVCAYRCLTRLGLEPVEKDYPTIQELNNDQVIAQFFHISLDSGKGIKPDSTTSLFLNNRFFSSKVIKKIRFDETINACEDQDFLIRLFPFVDRGVVISEVLFYYRRRKSSLSNKPSAKEIDLKVYSRLFSNISSYPKSLRIGIQMEYINLLVQNIFDKLASRASLKAKYKYYNEFLSNISCNFEFELNRSHKKKISLLRRGFILSIVWATFRSLTKKIRNLIRSYKFFP